jgi:hypothetical protein
MLLTRNCILHEYVCTSSKFASDSHVHSPHMWNIDHDFVITQHHINAKTCRRDYVENGYMYVR